MCLIASIIVSAVQTKTDGLRDMWQAYPLSVYVASKHVCILQLTCKVVKSELSGYPNAIKVDLALRPLSGALPVIGRQRSDPERAVDFALLAAATGI